MVSSRPCPKIYYALKYPSHALELMFKLSLFYDLLPNVPFIFQGFFGVNVIFVT